jgi:hypothetical protein
VVKYFKHITDENLISECASQLICVAMETFHRQIPSYSLWNTKTQIANKNRKKVLGFTPNYGNANLYYRISFHIGRNAFKSNKKTEQWQLAYLLIGSIICFNNWEN